MSILTAINRTRHVLATLAPSPQRALSKRSRVFVRSSTFSFPAARVFRYYTMSSSDVQKATFGAGCFWGTDKLFRKQFDLISCYTGYLGGSASNPDYKQVCTGKTGHAEVIQVEYKPKSVDYRELVKFFFRMHDPTTLNRQGNDVGTQYRSAIFYHSEEQKKIAHEVLDEYQKTKFPNAKIVTEISPATEFWKAEDYHQEYLIKNPDGYCNHRLRW